MNEALAHEMFDIVASELGKYHYGTHVALDIVERFALMWPAYPWLDWASDWEHEQLAKRYAA